MSGLRRQIFLTLTVIYLVIAAGGIVRMTGSGMGCPDWPKCFGQWIPPVSVEELPADYQQIYADRGYKDTRFNVFHTWTEYLNRLIGALSGLFMLSVLFHSFRLWRRREVGTGFFVLTLLGMLLFLFQAWLGSVVVETLLAPFMITIHMLFALVIVGLLIFLYHSTHSNPAPSNKSTLKTFIPSLFLGFLTLQILMGTQVRSQVDEGLTSGILREEMIASLDILFLIHRSFSWVLLGLGLYLWYKTKEQSTGILSYGGLLGLLLLEIGAGILLNYFGLPPAFQAIHLVIASLIFGLSLHLRLSMYPTAFLSMKT